MKSEFEQVRDEIINTAATVRKADNAAAQREKEIRHDYETAIAKKAAALDSGDMSAFRAAGLEAEARRLDLEFFDGTRQKGPRPAATAETNTRIRGVLRDEYMRIRAEGLERLKEKFTSAVDECEEILRQFNALDELSATWDTDVMHENSPKRIISSDDRLMFAQMKNAGRGQLLKFDNITR